MAIINYHPPTKTSMVDAKPWGKVANCHSAVDGFFPACGLFDLTEGIYHGNPKTPYEQAEADQLDYLLDLVRCVQHPGCRHGMPLERFHPTSLRQGGRDHHLCRNGEVLALKESQRYLLDYRAGVNHDCW